ncbi:mucin-2-like [Cydia splendana]|uniref:mucin-2-like n=1 Tax=Cydia splendana TaxID=1100963 RepID=UPI00300C5D76
MRGDRVMAPCLGAILTVLSLVALSNAGPLGPLPNVTSEGVGLKEGSCVLGDVVYMAGDTFTGATPCERCACAAGSVQCAQERCEPRPGCKALHRPDHCCPTYQCECEQEGRVYGNGEKLVDPEDPCRVCYCQGGEVVCRRIACFVRDDCQPRLVPGRCCPEYDNCPLRGVTAIPGLLPSVSNMATTGASNAAPTPPKENIKQEITIKEITPVSEIPVITDVKIKEILPSTSIEVPEYPSSKSPLIPREAIPDKTVTSSAELSPKQKESVAIELISPLPTEQPSKPVEKIIEAKSTEDLLPSKISLSTQDSINSEIYPSHIPTIIATMGVPPITPDTIPAASTTRVAIIEEEDTSLFDHNPAFPPIPDDLSPVGTHEDEISEQNADGDNTNVHGEQHIASTLPPTSTTFIPKDTPTTTVRYILDTSTTTTTTKKPATETSTIITKTPEIETTVYVLTSTTPQSESLIKGSPMLNPWSAIPPEILKVPSSVPEDISGELDDLEEPVTAFEEPLYIATSTTTGAKLVDETTAGSLIVKETILPKFNEETSAPFVTTQRVTSTTTGPLIKLDETTTTPQKVLKNKYLLRSSEVTTTSIDTTQNTQTVASTTNGPVSKIVDETAAATISKEIIIPRTGEVTNTPFDTNQSTQTVTSTTTQPGITQSIQIVTSTTTEPAFKIVDETTISPLSTLKNKVVPRSSEVTNTPFDTTTQTTQRITDVSEIITSTPKAPEELTTGTVTKFNNPTEITAQTEFSSLPIETSDQNPHDSSESSLKDKSPSTETPFIVEITTAKATTETEKVTVAKTTRTTPSTPGSSSFENVETTEFVLTSFGSSESSTDSVEVIKISPTQKVNNAAIIDSSHRIQGNVLTDLRDLVGDVASISGHTDEPSTLLRTTTTNSFSDSEELMPVNAGYKSKNSNFNHNSITEIPLKTKSQLPVNKQKVVEIEGEDTDSIADAPPPHDKVEPTTRRPIIDNVSDSMPKNETDKKDIEIISQSYVPTINRRPTKVVMKKNNDKPLSEASTEQTLATASSDAVTSGETTPSTVAITESALSSEESATTADVTLGADASTTAAQ